MVQMETMDQKRLDGVVALIRKHGLTADDLLRAYRNSQEAKEPGIELVLRATSRSGAVFEAVRKVKVKWTPSPDFMTHPATPFEEKDPMELMTQEVSKLLVEEAAEVLPLLLRTVVERLRSEGR